MKKKEREATSAERIAAKEQKQQECATATAQKSCNTLNKGKRTASRSAAKSPTKRRRDADAAVGEPVAPPPLSPPAKTTTRGRTIKLLGEIQIVQINCIALITTTPHNLVIIAIVCGSIASFLMGGWGG
jgi:hypothetical protein